MSRGSCDRLGDAVQRFMAALPSPRNPSPELERERRARFALECRELRRRSGIGTRYTKATLKNLSATWTAQQRVVLGSYIRLGAVLDELIDQPQLLAIGGGRGTGKTWLACGLVNDYCDLGRPARYSTIVEYFEELKDAFGRGGVEPERMRRRYSAYELLVLDEVQLRDQDKAWQDAQLVELVDRRYRDCRATVLLSNLTPTNLHENLGPSIWRRLIEEGGVIEADWTRVEEVLRGN